MYIYGQWHNEKEKREQTKHKTLPARTVSATFSKSTPCEAQVRKEISGSPAARAKPQHSDSAMMCERESSSPTKFPPRAIPVAFPGEGAGSWHRMTIRTLFRGQYSKARKTSLIGGQTT